MRLLAIGDVHGCSRAWDALLDLVAPAPDDWIVTLGDYVDRGPDSCGVLDRLLKLHASGRLVALRGNHEEMMLRARSELAALMMWLEFGGQQTIDSYSASGYDASLAGVPQEHWDFLEHVCVDRFETPTHFFVHGGVDPRLPLAEQTSDTLRWQKFEAPAPHVSGKTMICGHTAQRSGLPRNLGHAVCLDTWVYGQGWLSCLDVGSGDVWQANQSGETRRSNLADYLEN